MSPTTLIDNDLHYLIMDYIEGQSVLDMLVANQQGFARRSGNWYGPINYCWR